MNGGNLERRACFEVRASARTLTGHAVKFNTEANLSGFRETILPGAFSASLAGDILALLDHDLRSVLGRTKSGTLKLAEDASGLSFELTLPDTQAGRDVIALAQRNDLGGMSFGFTVPKGGDEWDGDRRTLRTIDLKEISVVQAWPAYPDTSLALRSRPLNMTSRQRRIILAGARHGNF